MITPTAFASPKFWDKKVQEINTDLTVLGWIQYIFPIAQTGVDEEGTFPEVYKNDGSKVSIRVFPDGNSISFFTIDGAIQIDESDMYTVTMSLYVWADMTKVYPSKDYNYTTELLDDVMGVIDNHSAYNKLIDIEGVFSEFTQLEKLINQNSMLPRTLFKITFNADLIMC